jgi:hypothetical protein
MDWKNRLTKTPYLALFIVLISIGVGTASAAITITLAGDVDVTGNLDVVGPITGQTIDDLQNQINTAGIPAETETQIDNIEDNIISPIFGLEEIKIEVANIETTIESLAADGFIEKPNTMFLDFSMGNGVAITLDGSGDAFIPIDDDGSPTQLAVDEFRKVCVFVRSSETSATTLSIIEGKASGTSMLDSTVVSFDDLHCVDVKAPQFLIRLTGGTPSSSEFVKLWIYLTS